MKKICIMGNSHLACLKLGWDQIKENYQSIYDITFFGAKGTMLKNLTFRNGALCPTNKHVTDFFKSLSNGLDEIKLIDYDYYVLVGLDISFMKVIELYVSYRCERHTRNSTTATYISDECFALMLKGFFQESAGKAVIDIFQRHCDKPIYLVPAPYPGESVTRTSGIWKKLVTEEDLVLLKAQYLAAVTAIFGDLVPVVFPPETLLERPITTRMAYAKGAYNLELNSKFDDHHFGHMNATYGKKMLMTVFELI